MSYETISKMLIDLHDTTEGEVVYWEAKEQLSIPVTKSADTVRELLERMRDYRCGKLPPVIKLDKGSQLVRSRNGDCYYYMNARTKFCTCPEFTKDRGCSHLVTMIRQNVVPKEHLIIVSEMPKSSIKEAEAV